MGRYFEELEPGFQHTTGTRTVTEQDIDAFAELTGDRNALHASGGGSAMFGGRVAHGLLATSLAAGLLSESGLTRDTLVALLGITWSYRAPVRPGDVLQVIARVAERRTCSRPGCGVVRFALTVRNQQGVTVQEGELLEMIRTRD